MQHTLPPLLVGVTASIAYAVNTLFWTNLLFLAGLLRWLVPLPAWRQYWTRIMHELPDCWIGGNTWIMQHISKTKLVVEGIENLNPNEWYLMIANHQSWADILVLQAIFNRKIPLLKFFIKKELLWTLPFASWACWLLDFPFMERHKKTTLAKHPELKGRDMETTRKACEKFKDIPTTIISFVEGTRFTAEKQQKRQSPYQYLLRPKAKGIALVLAAMGNNLHYLLNVTIVYTGEPIDAWQFFCGKAPKIIVNVETIPITPDLFGNYENDRHYRVYFQNWLNQLWQAKDKTIATLIQ